jgi:pimeloyl-ACP methyl ester carboxylesterase
LFLIKSSQVVRNSKEEEEEEKQKTMKRFMVVGDSWMIRGIIVPVVVIVFFQFLGHRRSVTTTTTAWSQCSKEDGGGMCPDNTTCCSTERSGISACIPVVHAGGPRDEPTGKCCGDNSNTGCRFGYECALSSSLSSSLSSYYNTDDSISIHMNKTMPMTMTTIKTKNEVSTDLNEEETPTATIINNNNNNFNNINNVTVKYSRYCKVTKETLLFDPSALDIPRYNLCRTPSKLQDIYGFPIEVPSGQGDSDGDGDGDSGGYHRYNKYYNDSNNDSNNNNDDLYHLAYYSNVGSITPQLNEDGGDDSGEDKEFVKFEGVEKAIIIIHGSLRDADDYFCTGLSLIQKENDINTNTNDNVMIIAPKFLSVDDKDKDHDDDRFLVWADQVEAYGSFLWHPYRYGADAANAPISSYTALDILVEYLVTAIDRFPMLQDITLVGHSAGGQMLQRWALLSNNPAWNTMNIRVVVANPNSYCYLDDRRWLAPVTETETANAPSHIHDTKDYAMVEYHTERKNHTPTQNNNKIFRRPTNDILDSTSCPEYNKWLWGLEGGGELSCSYRDNAVAEIGSTKAIAERYPFRNVVSTQILFVSIYIYIYIYIYIHISITTLILIHSFIRIHASILLFCFQ